MAVTVRTGGYGSNDRAPDRVIPANECRERAAGLASQCELSMEVQAQKGNAGPPGFQSLLGREGLVSIRQTSNGLMTWQQFGRNPMAV